MRIIITNIAGREAVISQHLRVDTMSTCKRSGTKARIVFKLYLKLMTNGNCAEKLTDHILRNGNCTSRNSDKKLFAKNE